MHVHLVDWTGWISHVDLVDWTGKNEFLLIKDHMAKDHGGLFCTPRNFLVKLFFRGPSGLYIFTWWTGLSGLCMFTWWTKYKFGNFTYIITLPRLFFILIWPTRLDMFILRTKSVLMHLAIFQCIYEDKARIMHFIENI